MIWTRDHPPAYIETTFTLDLCNTLKKVGPKDENCPGGSKVCGIEKQFSPGEGNKTGGRGGVIPIAGEYYHTIGGSLDPKWTRLKTSSAPDDRGKEGLRLEMGGGKYPEDDGKVWPQKAVIEFLCNEATEEKQRSASGIDKEDEGDERNKAAEETDDGVGGKLRFLDYGYVGENKVLSLEWQTKYACENAKGDGGKAGGHWGFFTWFIIIIFLAIAAYLVFGSWLNYNRYSARGWDLVPHSETLRDIPYIFKDWMRRVVSTVQGGGSRGGYSAV